MSIIVYNERRTLTEEVEEYHSLKKFAEEQIQWIKMKPAQNAEACDWCRLMYVAVILAHYL